MQKDEWKKKLHGLMRGCQDELSKATNIGKKMITASQTNSNLQDSYIELGKLAAKHLEAGILEWENPRVDELLEEIELHKKDLQSIESEVQKIKAQSDSESD
ncbi:MAG: hypothetical protein BM556_04155 [Bacteriovorax sp. MedPE-SWde]|nr:MAG: hypothetical protein BM556_04155 [Bacteriovorax sp. MedPE-SWde]